MNFKEVANILNEEAVIYDPKKIMDKYSKNSFEVTDKGKKFLLKNSKLNHKIDFKDVKKGMKAYNGEGSKAGIIIGKSTNIYDLKKYDRETVEVYDQKKKEGKKMPTEWVAVYDFLGGEKRIHPYGTEKHFFDMYDFVSCYINY